MSCFYKKSIRNLKNKYNYSPLPIFYFSDYLTKVSHLTKQGD